MSDSKLSDRRGKVTFMHDVPYHSSRIAHHSSATYFFKYINSDFIGNTLNTSNGRAVKNTTKLRVRVALLLLFII